MLVPVGQEAQLVPTGTGKGQKRPLLVPWDKSYTHAGGLSLSQDKLYTHDGACPSSTCPNLSHKVGLQGREKVGHGGLKEYVVNRFSPCPYFAGLFRALQAPCGIAIHYDPKTLIEMWIICLDPVSANSEKCIGCQWAVTPVAGLIFETKNRAIFLERFFWRDFSGEKLLPVQLCSH